MSPSIDRRLFLKTAGGASLLAAQSTPAKMKAGTAKVDVTPDRPLICAADGKKPATIKPYHPIHARCLTLNDGRRRIVFVTYDFNCLDVATPILRERCERELGVGPEYLILLATHNHQAPIQIVPENFEYGRWLAENIFGIIKEAISKEDGPVELSYGFGHGYFIRVGANAAPDYEIQVLKVMKNAKPVALLFNHPTHPLYGPPNTYGPSHPGYAMDEVEEKFPGALALYADACGGNQYTMQPDGVGDPLAGCKQRGHELAEVVVNVARGRMQDITGAIESKMQRMDLPLAPPLSYAQAMEVAQGHPLDIGFVPFPERERPYNWIRSLVKHYKDGIPFPTRSSDDVCTDDEFMVAKLDSPRKYECRFEEVVAARIGPLQMMFLQGEPCTPIGARIKEVLRQRGPVMLFGYFAEHNLYIPTREIVRVDGYQAQVIQTQYGSSVTWSPEVEDEMVKGALAVAGAEPWPNPRPVQKRKFFGVG
jgi:hypothetical protein